MAKKMLRFSEDMDPAEAEDRLAEQSEAARLAWIDDPSEKNAETMHDAMEQLQAARAYWRGIREALGQPSVVVENNTGAANGEEG